MIKQEIKKLAVQQAKKDAGNKQLKKESTAKYKAEIKASDNKLDKKRLKKEFKYYKKEVNKKVRYMAWTLVAVVFVILAVQFGPLVKSLLHATGASDITMDSSTPEGQAALKNGDHISLEIAKEGIVLMKNEDDSLPLNNEKINVFGLAPHVMRFGGGGSGNSDQSRKVSFFDSLDAKGIEYNKELAKFYSSNVKTGADNAGMLQMIKTMVLGETFDELENSKVSEQIIDNAKQYSNKALIFLSSSGSEASDMTVEQLQITQNKKDMIEMVASNFDDVTVIINAGNTLELGLLEDYPSIKSIVWVGTPGPYGALALADILKGNVNPSGRLVDTYAYDIRSNPASENFGDYKYDNLKKAFINYQEGIYVGYRYYETRYAKDEETYNKVVQYPFGYGLSYTDFQWEVVNSSFNEETISVDVKVTNNGLVAGKDVVQLYFNAPYIDGGLEKSETVLGDFTKTNLLEPNESEIVTLSFSVRDMASYDTSREAYILDAGNYKIRVATNVHETFESIDYTVNETVEYKTNSKTNVAYANQFEDAKGDIQYLLRSDWDGTYPSDKDISHTAPDSLLETIDKLDVIEGLELPELNQEVTLKLEDLKGLDYDDPKWNEFLNQFTLDELMDFVTNGAYKTIGIERLGIEQKLLMDGPAGFSYVFKKYEAAAYPTEIVVASTWNKDLAYLLGEAAGKEAVAYGIDGWYAPAMNIHRTPLGGRNFEYFSEDPYLSGIMSAEITKGAQDQGVIVFIKHFAMNDQETNARSGIVLWADEQAIREIYLKPFEITVKESEPKAAMSSFSYIGPKWAGEHTGLLNNILREEWGFDGFVSSDAVFGFMSADRAVVSGNDLMLDIMSPHKNKKALKKAYKENPAFIVKGLQDSVHNILYTFVNFQKN
ncbi:glycoside hydrolase family 3 N-terminal domain-containing protein [Paenibacillus yanchengensis]|uniref:Glycoside hydrolase family 3 N-terminal domain-containing protein n=1 Tax=Paenibacillus yanchengensis TaxID=2035833 RepID=A0ABW4YQT6_9BACL